MQVKLRKISNFLYIYKSGEITVKEQTFERCEPCENKHFFGPLKGSLKIDRCVSGSEIKNFPNCTFTYYVSSLCEKSKVLEELVEHIVDKLYMKGIKIIKQIYLSIRDTAEPFYYVQVAFRKEDNGF